MTENELAQILKTMYENAENRKQAAMIHLFGIKYAEEIKKAKVTPARLLKLANMHDSYKTEIRKGTNLAQFVDVKPQYK